MIKELVQFTDSLDDELKTIGILPKEGLHIMLSYEEENDETLISAVPKFEVFSKKQQDVSIFLRKCASLAQSSWMVNTNKCFDLPAKGIHSCSPYCLAFKRESIKGGGKYNEAKVKLYNRVNSYFNKAIELLEDETGKQKAKIFQNALNSEDKIHGYLDVITEFSKLKDTEYIVFYLNVSVDKYLLPYNKYLSEKLFNTEEHNVTGTDSLTYGTSNFFNGFNSKKPFLMHQSATFNITNRISSNEAKSLFDFESIALRRILPNPLPIFIFRDEKKESIALFKRNALEGSNKRGYQQIIESLQSALKKELGNYYLLFNLGGEIKDFDFVSKFEYELKDSNNNNWYIDDLFNCNYTYIISNVFEFERSVLPVIFNNALVVKTKTASLLFKYFDDIDLQYCKTDNTFLLVMKYRKALYDYVYKSNRTGFTQKAFEDVLLIGLLDDIRLDKYENNKHSENFNIRQKLNILFSLHQNFQPFKTDPRFMPTQILELRQNFDSLANGEVSLTSEEHFAFAAGQVIYYILSKSNSADKSYSRLEPFLQLSDTERLKQAILKIFNTYKHERFSRRFSNPFAEVMAYSTNNNLRDYMPLILAGYFSPNQLFGKGQDDNTNETE